MDRGQAIARIPVECIRIGKPLIGCLRDIVAFRHPGSIASLRRELHGRLKEVHVEPDHPVELGKLPVCQ